MARQRNHYRYQLKDGHRIVYIGITNDPDRRLDEHEAEGKGFGHMRIVGPSVTRETAAAWEAESLKRYRWAHRGRNPKYNETES